MSVILAVGPAILRCYASYWHKNVDSKLSIGRGGGVGGVLLHSPTLNSKMIFSLPNNIEVYLFVRHSAFAWLFPT